MSDRSVGAETISSSVVITGDGNIVTANFGDTGAHLALRRPHFPAFRRQRPARAGKPRELTLFAPDSDALALQGRQDFLAGLRAWLDDPADLSVHALIGQAGSGKTRLAVELCRAIDPPDGAGHWRAGFVSPPSIETIVEILVTRHFVWDKPTLLVLDYAATAHRALARWLDALASPEHLPKLRFLLLERSAPEGVGWWDLLTNPSLRSESGRYDLFFKPRPDTLPGLEDSAERRALLRAAQQAAHGLRGTACAAAIPPPGVDPAFDRLLAEPRFGNPLNLVMAGVIACDQTPLGALGMRRLDAALHLARRELARLEREAAAEGISNGAIRHITAFNCLAGGLPIDDLPAHVAAELGNAKAAADSVAVARLLLQEFPAQPVPKEAERLSVPQPDLIGEALAVSVFEGEAFLAGAVRTVRRAYAIGSGRAAEALVRIVQDFAFALEEQGATAAEKAHGREVMSWLTELAGQMDTAEQLLPLVNALPGQTLVLREAAVALYVRLATLLRSPEETASAPEDFQVHPWLLNNLATRLSDLGRREEALSAAREAADLYRALAAARPDAFTPNLAMSLNNLANRLSALGRREEALSAAQEAVQLRRALAAARPDAFTPNLAGSLNNLANMLSALGRREEALSAAQEAADLYRALAAARPDAFTPNLAGSLNNLANMLSDLGRREEALSAAREAADLYRALAAARPDAFTPDLAMSLNNLANMLSDLGRREEALSAAREAADLYRALAAARPDAFTPNLAMSLNNLANMLSALGRREEALSAAQEAADLYRALAAARPDAFTPDLAMSLNNLANMLSDLGRREEALSAAREAVQLRRALAAARPDAFTPNLASALNNLANMLSDLGRREEALSAAQEAADLYRALAAARPDAFTPNLASALNNLANMLSDLGRREEALSAAQEAADLYRALAAAPPDAFTPDLASALNNLANMLSDLGRREEALSAAQEAVQLRRALAAARPDAFDTELARSLWVEADLRAETGDLAGAIDALADAVRRLIQPFDRYPAAIRGLMEGISTSYGRHCEAAGQTPDGDLLAPVIVIFQRLQPPDPPR